jgi:predicted nucleotidyltransferase
MKSKLEILNEKQSMSRKIDGLALVAEIKKILLSLGVESRLFGSMSTGEVHADSDVDILITDRNGVDRGLIVYEINSIETSIPVDIIFMEDVDIEFLPYILRSVHE